MKVNTYNTLDLAIRQKYKLGHLFVVGEEVGHKGSRKYRAYNTFDDFISDLESGIVKHCHEQVCDKKDFSGNVVSHQSGRLVFDIDGRDTLPVDFKDVFIQAVVTSLNNVIDTSKSSFDTEQLVFNWLDSSSKSKTSMHVVVYNCLMENWKECSSIVYEELEKHLPKEYLKFVDKQLIRNRASLRMPLCRKLGSKRVLKLVCSSMYIGGEWVHGNNSLYDKDKINPYTYAECTIRSIRRINGGLTENEQQVTFNMFKQKKVKKENVKTLGSKIDNKKLRICTSLIENQYQVENSNDTTLVKLTRNKAGECPISCKYHESDNAYMFEKEGKLFFGCHRGCKTSKGKKVIPLYEELRSKEDVDSRIRYLNVIYGKNCMKPMFVVK